MVAKATQKPAVELTDEEKAARKEAAREASLRRDRVRMLASAESAVKRARQALQAGDDEEHRHWLTVGMNALDAYQKTTQRSNGATTK